MTSGWQPVLEQLVRERYGRLLARARMLGGSPDGADDLVQDALMSVFASSARFTSIGEAEHYVRLAIASRAVDRSRRRRREQQALVTVAGWPASAVADPAEQIAGAATAALATLSPRQRACVVLRHLDDQSVAQTAHLLGISPGAVKRYTSEAVTALRGALAAVGVALPPELDENLPAERSAR